ncbi:uncharacterized protein LOC116232553 [Phasianus colchicus]|nr:uncharacterized protein LOC116232553 [Phasianus colchicus]
MSVDSQRLIRSPSTETFYCTTKANLQSGVRRAAPGTKLLARGAPRQAVTQHSSQLCPASCFHKARSLSDIRECVRKFRGKMVEFKKQPQFRLRVGGLEGSFYEGQEELKEYCEVLYLPQPTKMEVVGTVDDVPCLATGQQLVILIAESLEVYAYEEETLHKVAKNMQEFTNIGLQHLGKEVYHCGANVDSLGEAERDKDPAIQQLRQSAQHFLEGGKEDFQLLLDLL